MSITINIKNTEPKINIVKDREAEEKLIQEIATKVVNNLEENPDVVDKVKIIGKEKLREIAVDSLRETIKQSEEKQIEEAKQMSAEITSAMLSGVIKATLAFDKDV